MPWKIALLIAGGLYLYKSYNGYLKEKDYINALKGTGSFVIKYDELPTDRLLVGKGFLWGPEYPTVVNRLMQDKKLLEEGESLGGLSFIHGVGIRSEKDISVPLSDLVGHSVIIGTTRVGKTRAYEILISQAIKRGEPVVIFDPKGDKELLDRVVETCRVYGRGDDFMFFALPYPKFSAHYNPLKNFTLPNEIPDRIANLLPGGGDSDTFRSFAWQVISVITNAMLYLNLRPNIRLISEYSLAKTNELCKRCISEAFRRNGHYNAEIAELDEEQSSMVEDYIKLYHNTTHAEVKNDAIDNLILLAKHPKEHFQKMIASLTPLLSKLSTGEIGTLMSDRSDSGDDIDWERAIKNNKVVYMLFGSLLMRDTAKSVVRMALQDFTSFVGAKYCYIGDKKVTNLFIDEFTEVVDPTFVNLLNKAGGSGVRILLASQSVADLESELRSAAKAQQIFDNLNTKLWLRTADMATAEVFSNAAGTVSVRQESSGVSVSPDMSSSELLYKSSYSQNTSEKSVPLVDPSWFLKLPKGQGFVISSGRVFKVRIPLLQDCKTNYYAERGIA